MISCINFTISGISPKDERNLFLNSYATDKEPLFYSETHSDLPYKERQDIHTLPVFRNTSKLFYSSELLSEYIKSSYFLEGETALNDGYAYLFGTRWNKKTSKSLLADSMLQKVTNQICRDLVCGVRFGQKEPKIPVHIIQSNTLDIRQYIFNATKIDDSIPGRPNIIVHAYPLWAEVLVAFQDDKIEFSSDEEPLLHLCNMTYKNARPVYEFKFSLPKKGYVDCYTITHWALNTEPKQYRSFPMTVNRESLKKDLSQIPDMPFFVFF